MKCPKCGYLGFETTDRCRNCGYDFSLAPFSSEPDLPLRDADKAPSADFDLPNISKPADASNASSLDLDRLFGAESPAPAAALSSLALQTPDVAVAIAPVARLRASAPFLPSAKFPKPMPEPEPTRPPDPAPAVAVAAAPPRLRLPNTQVIDITRVQPEPDYTLNAAEIEIPLDLSAIPTAKPVMNTPAPEDLAKPEPASALPFDAAPIAPPPARPPLAVRRSTPEVPRGRRHTPRPARIEPKLGLEAEKPAVSTAFRSITATSEVTAEPPSLSARVIADLIDLLLLALIDATVLVLTLRIAGLTMIWDDLRVVPAIPFVGFLALLAFGYVAAFTVAGGQTIGKMLMGIKVIGDDGRAVDAAGGVLRALGCALVPLTLGLSYIPVLVTSDRRALHDRLAGTRVVTR